MKKTLVVLLLLTLSFSVVFASAASESKSESDWPVSTVQLIVSAKAGGGTDLVARILAAKMQELTGTSVVVQNITDGNGAVAFSTVMADDEDALKLGLNIPSFFTSYITGATDMNPKTDFQCASFLELTDCNYFVVSKDSPFKTMEQLMTYVKAHPGEVTLGLSIGSRTHFTVAEFAKAAGLEFKYVEAGKAADQVTALLGGHIDVTYLNIANTKSNVEAGTMIALASQCDPAEPVASLKNVPTFADLGYGDLKCKCDFFINTSIKTSAETISKINSILTQICADPQVKADLLKLGYAIKCASTSETKAMYEKAYQTWDEVGKTLGVNVH